MGLSLASLACNGDFNDGKTRSILESNPVRLDAEQVMLTPQQVQCGVQSDLWEPPGQITVDRSVARLTPQGRALKFADDISVTDPGYRSAYVQVRGDFNLGVIEIQNTRDGPDKDTKLVDVRLGIKLDHACFSSPLPIMGLRKGRFSEESSPVLLFHNDNGWQFDSFVH